MGIGNRIREAREKRGLTQKELANQLGITASAVTNYENDTSHPKEPVLYAIMQVLQVDANFLFQDHFAAKKELPAPSEDGAEEPTLEEDIKLLTDLFVARGYIKPGEDLSDRDAAVLEKLIELLDLYFQGRN